MNSESPKSIESFIEDIAYATLQYGGVAFKLDTCQFLPPMDVWAFPKYPSNTAIQPQDVPLIEALREFILASELFLREPDCWFGTWIHPQTHEFYLDLATSCADLNMERKMAFEASQRERRRIVAI
jgi:hypothetical protein